MVNAFLSDGINADAFDRDLRQRISPDASVFAISLTQVYSLSDHRLAYIRVLPESGQLDLYYDKYVPGKTQICLLLESNLPLENVNNLLSRFPGADFQSEDTLDPKWAIWISESNSPAASHKCN